VDLQQDVARPSRWRLYQTVEVNCGPATKFSVIEHRFADWLDANRYVSPAVKEDVEPYLAGYLATAAAAGRRWGVLVGLTVGAVLGVVAASIATVIW
jgi:hypothetical protein